jgi:hypothetical protein
MHGYAVRLVVRGPHNKQKEIDNCLAHSSFSLQV